MSEQKDPEYVARGLKAAVHNPRTSEEAKASAAQRLDDMGVEIEQQAFPHKAGTHAPTTGVPRHQMGTSLDTENVSGHTRGRYSGMEAENYLDDEDPETFGNRNRSSGADSGQTGEHRVMGGYRATLKNPRVSEEAKEHAKEVLEEHGEPFSTR